MQPLSSCPKRSVTGHHKEPQRLSSTEQFKQVHLPRYGEDLMYAPSQRGEGRRTHGVQTSCHPGSKPSPNFTNL